MNRTQDRETAVGAFIRGLMDGIMDGVGVVIAAMRAAGKPAVGGLTIALALGLTIAFALALAGCGGTDALLPDAPPGCQIADLTLLTAEYTAALVWTCREYGSLDECPEPLRLPIEQRYSARIDQWERCDLTIQRTTP